MIARYTNMSDFEKQNLHEDLRRIINSQPSQQENEVEEAEQPAPGDLPQGFLSYLISFMPSFT